MEWNKPTVPPSALVLSHLSSHPRDKLIVTNWYFYTPFRILRRIFSVRTREQSFHSRVLTVQPWYIIYDTVVRNDWRPWIAIYDTTKSATRKRENFFPLLPPNLLLFYVKFQRPGFRRLSSGIGPWRRRCKFVANSANAQDQRVYIHTFHLSVHLKSNQSWNYEIIMSKSQGVFVRFIATFYFARLPRTGLRYVIGYSFLVYFASLNC